MFSEYFGYILQGITILITLSLGLVTSYQTKKLQHGKKHYFCCYQLSNETL